MTEVVNIMIIVKSRTTYEILYDFVALKVIAEIDDMMAQTLRMENLNVDESIEESKNKHTYESKRTKDMIKIYKELYRKDPGVYSGFLFTSNVITLYYSKLIKFLYNLIYYYFMPFIVVLLVILYGVSMDEINKYDD